MKNLNRNFFNKFIALSILLLLLKIEVIGQTVYKEISIRYLDELYLESISYSIRNPNIVKYTNCSLSDIDKI